MKKRNLIIIISVVLLISLLIARNYQLRNTLSQEDKIEDFSYLYEVLEENYPYFEILKEEKNYDWLANKDEFIEKIENTENDIEFYYALDDIIKEVDDKHMDLLTVNSYQSMKDILNNMPTEYKDEYKPWLKVINNQDSSETYTRFESIIDDRKIKNNFREEEPIETKIIEDHEIAYIKINSFNDSRRMEERELLMDFWKATEEFSNIIIDIRGNGGGSDLYWMDNIVSPLINEALVFETYSVYKGGQYSMPFIESWDEKLFPIQELPDLNYDPINDCSDLKYFMKDKRVIEPMDSTTFQGDIYLLIDEVNYSAADSFSAFCKFTDFATVVGKETSGGGMGFAPIIVKLPNSGLIVRFPIDMALNPDGSTNVIEHTKPDVKSKKPLEKVMSIINQQN